MSEQATLPVDSPRAAGAESIIAWRRWSAVVWPLAGLIALLAFDAVFIRNFFHVTRIDGRLTGSLIDLLRWGAPLILLTAGMTLVIATGGVDLSVGAVMALAAASAAWLELPSASGGAGLSSVSAALVALAISLVAGAWNGMLVALFDIQPIVATLVLMVAGRGIARLFIGAGNAPLAGATWDVLRGTTLGLPSAALIAFGVFAACGLFTRLTPTGIFIEATGANPIASRYAGVRVRRVVFLVYVFCGGCAGLAGLIYAADTRTANATSSGMYMELDAILAAVLGGAALTGGRFSLAGSLVGALLIQTLSTTLIYKVPQQRALVVKALVVLAVCLLQSEAMRTKLRRSMKRRAQSAAVARGAAETAA